LPGGQVFITAALYLRLENEDQLAGVLGHEIGHVLGRHSSERIAKSQLGKGLTDALVIATGDRSTSQIAHQVNTVIQMSHGRDQELESDDLGVRLMMQAGYEPMEMIGVMKILKEASGGSQRPEWQSSHPNPENRAEKIIESIQKYGGERSLPG
jgi:predicted Zn-dependent protease